MAVAEYTFTDNGGSVGVTSTLTQSVAMEFPKNATLISKHDNGVLRFTLHGRIALEVSHAQIVSPSTADIDADLVVLRDYFNSSSGGGPTPMNLFEIVYVSPSGSPSGTGALDDPLSTIADGIALAQANTLSSGLHWNVHVLPGSYDEQINPLTAQVIYIELYGGVEVDYSGSGDTIVDSSVGVNIFMHLGSMLSNSGTGHVISAANSTRISGFGAIVQGNSSVSAVDVGSLSGNLTIEKVSILNTSNTLSVNLVTSSDGVLLLDGCRISHWDSFITTEPIYIVGSGVRLMHCQIYAPSSTYSLTGDGANPVQVVNCTSNVGATSVTQTVGAMLVDPLFTA